MRAFLRRGLLVCASVGGLLSGGAVACGQEAALGAEEQLADELVRTALRFQLERQPDYREMTLYCALRTAPDFGPANWQAGRLQVDGKWLPIEQAQRQAAQDKLLDEYVQLREAVSGDPQRLVSLARWCARNRLEDRSKLHYLQILQHSGSDEAAVKEALKKLDLKVYAGQLLTDEQIAQQQKVEKQIAAAIESWRPKLLRLRDSLLSDSAKKREHARQELQAIDDAQVIAALQSFAGDADARFAEELIEALSRFVEHEASVALVHFAVLNPNPTTCESAAQRLRKRPLHEFVPLLLAGLQTPIDSRFRIVRSQNGSVHYEHDFFREGRRKNFAFKESHTARAIGQRILDRAIGPAFGPVPNAPRGRTVGGRNSFEAQVHAATAAVHAHETEKEVAKINVAIFAANQPVFSALETGTGQVIARSAAKWWEWWQEHNEIYAPPKSTQYAYDADYTTFYNSGSLFIPMMSCFVAGTPVWTETGRRPIEEIQPGDRVLAQDPDTGELALKVVTSTTLRPPANLIQLNAGGDEITTTLGHPMWLCGTGWRMAKLLVAGQELHSLGGAVTIDAVEKLARQRPAHNLVVEDFHTYFVGEKGLLVHDNIDREPTTALVPGLLAESSSRASAATE